LQRIRKIKVLFDQPVIANYNVGMYKSLASRPDIHLTVSYWADRFEEYPPHNKAEINFETVSFRPIRWKIFGKLRWLNLDLFKYVIRDKPEVVIGAVGMFGINTVVSCVAEYICSLISGTRFVYRASYGLLPEVSIKIPAEGLRRIWYKVLYRNAIMLTYTQKAADIAIALGCNPESVFIDFNSMDSEDLQKIRKKFDGSVKKWKPYFLRSNGISDHGYVLFTGRLSEDKRLDLLIEAWKHVIEQVPDTLLVVVGSGPDRERGIDMARGLGVIFVKGQYDTRELAKYYYLSDIVVFPGYATLSTHFAMCFGKPIICSQYGNEAEYIQDGINGFVYKYGDVNDLADKLIRLLRNHELRCRFGLASERMVKEIINIQHMVDTIAKAIHFAGRMGKSKNSNLQ